MAYPSEPNDGLSKKAAYAPQTARRSCGKFVEKGLALTSCG